MMSPVALVQAEPPLNKQHLANVTVMTILIKVIPVPVLV